MPQPDLEKFDQRQLCIAPAGTPINNAVHGLLLLDGSSARTGDAVERNIDTPYLGAKPQGMTNFRATINGDIDLRPPTDPGHATNGIPPTALDLALRACGLARSFSDSMALTRYNPISTGFSSVDMSWWHATTLTEVESARGDLSQIRTEIGQSFKARLALTGEYDELQEEALPTDVDLSAFEGEPTISEPENSVMILSTDEDTPEIDELHLRAKSLISNLGHQVGVKRYTEFRETGINARGASYTAVFAKPDFAEFNPDAIMRSRKFILLSYKISEPDGRYSLHTIRGQIDQCRDTDVDGDRCFEISGRCIPSAPAGNDEVRIEFGNDTFAIRGTWPGGTEDVVYVPGTGINVAGEHTAPVTYAVTAGALPTGLTLSSAGVLSGTPTAAGPYTFTVTATDSTSGTALTATKEFSITIAAP